MAKIWPLLYIKRGEDRSVISRQLIQSCVWQVAKEGSRGHINDKGKRYMRWCFSMFSDGPHQPYNGSSISDLNSSNVNKLKPYPKKINKFDFRSGVKAVNYSAHCQLSLEGWNYENDHILFIVLIRFWLI